MSFRCQVFLLLTDSCLEFIAINQNLFSPTLRSRLHIARARFALLRDFCEIVIILSGPSQLWQDDKLFDGSSSQYPLQM